MFREIKLTDKQMISCVEFSELRYTDKGASGNYNKRGGFKFEDIVVGAMAEIAVYRLLKKQGFAVKKPDFTLHDASKRSYDADLCDGTRHFHVKGQSLKSAKLYGDSWIMQRTDPLLNTAPLHNYLVPCTVDLDTRVVKIHGIIPFRSLVDKNLIGECRLEWFRKTKVAIYLDQITSVMTTNALWGIFYRGGK